MKKFVAMFLLTISIGAIHGCASAPEVRRENAPLQTEGNAKPPAGCVDLRKRGGAC